MRKKAVNPLPHSTANASEIEKFSRIADEWWNPKGKFRPLHLLNPVRLSYIRDIAAAHFGRELDGIKPLKNLSILDIGCGGGLLSLPLARMGANVTGIDASEKNIRVASLYAEKQRVAVSYKTTTAEALLAEKKSIRFDVVLAMEVVEHVDNVDVFLETCAALVKPGGLLFMSTLNRTLKSYMFAIVGAEYVLNWLPRGTHDWNKFLKPSEIVLPLEKHGLKTNEILGVNYSPLANTFGLTNDPSVNYMLYANKEK